MDQLKRNLKQFFKYYTPLIITTIIFAVVGCTIVQVKKHHSGKYYKSTNQDRVYGSQAITDQIDYYKTTNPVSDHLYGASRVFDYADFLSTNDENYLNAYIQMAEKKVCLDLVFVNLPEDYDLSPSDFYQDGKFGYDAPGGDGILLMDSYQAKISPMGRAVDLYSSSLLEDEASAFESKKSNDYLQACVDWVDSVVAHCHVNTRENQRVFDYGDQLTTEEEEELEDYIAKAEKKTCLDLVILTLDESLAYYDPYTAGYGSFDENPHSYGHITALADEFWESNRFGYDQAQVLDGSKTTGDGLLLVDNVYRESDGWVYTWLCTTGRAETDYSSSAIDSNLDAFYEDVKYNYYDACIDWVDACIAHDSIDKSIHVGFGFFSNILILLVIVIYYHVNSKEKPGKVTTTAETYLIEKSLSYPIQKDQFKNKVVTKRYNPPSSSSGGGGSHRSGGGGSHGGGGHHR